MEKWITINDVKIRHVWRCAECEDEVKVVPWDYQNIGTPYCADCDQDMAYLSTEMST
jgi:Zn finger protein HypA/HybF involved in hydrogenase expression